VHVSKTAEEPPPNTDVILSGPVDLDVAIKRVMDALKQRGVLDETLGTKPTFQYSI
jgi:bifunctional enzyme CysN/CysC